MPHPIPFLLFLRCLQADGGLELAQDEACFSFAPSAAASTFEDMLAECPSIRYLRGLQLTAATASPNGQGLASVTLQRVRGTGTVTAKGSVFIDASYEGDLLALAEVPFMVGREGTKVYNESIAGRMKVRGGNRSWRSLLECVPGALMVFSTHRNLPPRSRRSGLIRSLRTTSRPCTPTGRCGRTLAAATRASPARATTACSRTTTASA